MTKGLKKNQAVRGHVMQQVDKKINKKEIDKTQVL